MGEAKEPFSFIYNWSANQTLILDNQNRENFYQMNLISKVDDARGERFFGSVIFESWYRYCEILGLANAVCNRLISSIVTFLACKVTSKIIFVCELYVKY